LWLYFFVPFLCVLRAFVAIIHFFFVAWWL
jgi:hypothetical protein